MDGTEDYFCRGGVTGSAIDRGDVLEGFWKQGLSEGEIVKGEERWAKLKQ